MKKFILFLLVSISLPAWALIDMGGATSGGGDDVGIEVSRIVEEVSRFIRENPQTYSSDDSANLLAFAQIAKVVVVDTQLPATTASGVAQDGIAFSSYDTKEAVIQIQRARWKALTDPYTKEAVIHHELAVLSGIEQTGDYHLTSVFEALRRKFWESHLNDRTICNISLFKKITDNSTNTAVPGDSLGSVSVLSSLSGAEGKWDVLSQGKSLGENKYQSIIARYVVSSWGYLRLQISEAVVEVNSPYSKFFTVTKDLTPEITFYDPYNWTQYRNQPTLKPFDFGFVMASCTRF